MHRRQHGFTLVEIAIVLVIIGLLIGGVLKGQALIDSAKAKNLMQDFRGVPLMLHSYRDKYRALPGDDGNAARHLCPSSAPACTTGGDGNGRIDGNWDDDAGSEAFRLWQQLRLAGLATGLVDTADAGYLPRNAEGGRLGLQAGGAGAPLGVPGTHALCSSAIAGRFIAQLDVALDDGDPGAGTLRAGTVAAGALTALAAGARADEGTAYVVCLGF